MEWQFCINWSALVEEAKQRRKVQKLTQARLAMLAGVSTPTVSRFESQQTDIQLSTVLNILGVLGMVVHRQLVFAESTARYDTHREIVVFTGKDGDNTISCAITRVALEDHFNADNKNLLKTFIRHHERIEHEARRKYLLGRLTSDRFVLVTTDDM